MRFKRKAHKSGIMRKKRGKYMKHLERGTSPPRTSRCRQDQSELSDDGMGINDSEEFYKIVNRKQTLESSNNIQSSTFQSTFNKNKLHNTIEPTKNNHSPKNNPIMDKCIGPREYDIEDYERPTSMDRLLNRIETTDPDDSSHHSDYQDNGSNTSEDEDFWSTFANNCELDNKLLSRELDRVPRAHFVVTEAEILYGFTKFQEKYNLPVTALEDMCKLQNSFLNSAILPDTRYKLDQLLRNKDSVEYHAVCLSCKVYLRQFNPSERAILCKKCNKKVPVKGNDGNYFVIFNTQEEVKDLIEKHQESYVKVLNREQEPDVLKDIYNGVKYKEFVESLPPNERDSYVTCTFNTDGSPVFKNSNCSIWPIQMILNELPPQIRFDNSIVCALWFGRFKPIMEIFLKVFAKKINSINEEKIPCKIDGIMKSLTLYPICCCADAVARAPMQGLTQFNGRFGCNWCYHPGIPVKSKKKKVIKYPLLDRVPKKRTSKKMLKHMKKKLKFSATVYGVKKISALIHFKWFDLVDGFVVDVMHNTFLEELYGQSAMTYNVHQLLHLVESVVNWGPLWAHSGYTFENGNGKVVRMVNAANGVLSQICRRIEYKLSSMKLEKHILKNYEYSPVIEFVSRLGNTYTDKSVAIFENRYFGKPLLTDTSTNEALNLGLKNPVSYNKMVKDNCLFTSQKQHTPRSRNCFVQKKNGDFIQIVKFIIDERKKKELTVYNRVYTESSLINCKKIEKVLSIDKKERIMETRGILCIAVCVDTPSAQYISAVTNDLHY